MKVQNLAIIFLVIVIPLIMVLSYYLHLQQKTLELQASYDTKLSEATKEGIKAFEVNTVDWSEKEGRKKTSINNRAEAEAMINAFTTSLANNLNIAGTAKEYMINYIPAVAITMYDGYYIYAPAYVPVTAETDEGIQLFCDVSSGHSNKAIKASDPSREDEDLILYEAETAGETYYYEYVADDGAGRTETKSISGLTTNVENAKKEYKHTLNNKTAYCARYTNGTNTNVIVNYTLDNRIAVYGTVYEQSNGETVTVDKSGYLVYFDNNSSIPQAYVTTNNPRNDGDIVAYKKVSDTQYNGIKINSEVLEEQILYKKDEQYILETFKYVYDIKHTKLYFDPLPDRDGDGVAEGDFFTVNAKTLEREYINDEANEQKTKIGETSCSYKSISILWGTDATKVTEYKKVYQALNGKDRGKWCIGIKIENQDKEDTVDTEIKQQKMEELGLDTIELWEDCSAISYYTEAYAFTNWVKDKLGGNIKEQKIRYGLNETTKQFETKYVLEDCNGLFDISANNNPEVSTSQFVEHKRTVMKESINKNLNAAISNYSRNGTYGFKLPKLTDKDWEQVFNNISLISFFQGAPIGLKNYNNYAIATSTTNREYVDPNEIYFSANKYKQETFGDPTKIDNNYHRAYCKHCTNEMIYTGYRSVEYALKEYTPVDINGNTLDSIYYYQHDNQLDENSETACYYCVVNKANYEENITIAQEQTYNETLARERYYQEKSIEGNIGIKIIYDANLDVKGEVTGVYNVPETQDVAIGEFTKISTQRPYATTNNQFIKFIFMGWSLEQNKIDPNGNLVIDYYPGQEILCEESICNEDGDIKLYGVWKIALTNMDWYKDYRWTWPQEYWYTPAVKVNDGSISNIRILEPTEAVAEENLNTIIEMVGNGVYAGKGAMWTTFKSDFLTLSSFTFNYYINKGDSFNAAGFIFDIVDKGSYIEGYMLSINFKGQFKNISGDSNGAIFKFKYEKNTQSQNIKLSSSDLITTLPIGQYNGIRNDTGSGTISIKVNEDGGYTINGSEFNGIKYVIPPYNRSPDTFGFFSDHYSHGCEDIGYFKIDNIVVMATEK